jgi:hypothetical protein
MAPVLIGDNVTSVDDASSDSDETVDDVPVSLELVDFLTLLLTVVDEEL